MDSKGTEKKSAIEGWTKDEKYNLYEAIKIYGSYNISEICKVVETKNSQQIKEAIEYYLRKSKADTKVAAKKKGKNKKDSHQRIPLAMWANLLTDNYNYKELQTEIAEAMRLIADLEQIPAAISTDNINFKEFYHVIANAMEGKVTQVSPMTSIIIDKCLTETALSSKIFMKLSMYKSLISSINFNDSCVFPRPSSENDLAIFQNLASEKSYNPLNIPEQYFKPQVGG